MSPDTVSETGKPNHNSFVTRGGRAESGDIVQSNLMPNVMAEKLASSEFRIRVPENVADAIAYNSHNGLYFMKSGAIPFV